VYTSSIEAEAESLDKAPLDDYQLLAYETSYRPSKYMGDLIVTQLDRELGAEPKGEGKGSSTRPIRVISAEPGCVATNIAVAGLGAWAWLVQIKWICYWLSFYIANLLGSKHHPVYATEGAAPMLYAALVADTFLLPASRQPGPKVHVVSHRRGPATVQYGEVDQWEANADVARGLAERCEATRQDWHKREVSESEAETDKNDQQ
jgi:3-keto steroid reductase